MKVVVQRAKDASVKVNGKEVGSINKGLLLLVGFTQTDTEKELDWMVNKVLNLRIFEDENNKMNLSVSDIQGEFLIVSQFTLCSDCRKGTRPSFDNAMPPKEAELLYEYFCKNLEKESNLEVKTGQFGAMMDIALINDGPVTFMLEK